MIFVLLMRSCLAPARERGLKSIDTDILSTIKSRSREGAWIEILLTFFIFYELLSRSREGAWIEIS